MPGILQTPPRKAKSSPYFGRTYAGLLPATACPLAEQACHCTADCLVPHDCDESLSCAALMCTVLKF